MCILFSLLFSPLSLLLSPSSFISLSFPSLSSSLSLIGHNPRATRDLLHSTDFSAAVGPIQQHQSTLHWSYCHSDHQHPPEWQSTGRVCLGAECPLPAGREHQPHAQGAQTGRGIWWSVCVCVPSANNSHHRHGFCLPNHCKKWEWWRHTYISPSFWAVISTEVIYYIQYICTCITYIHTFIHTYIHTVRTVHIVRYDWWICSEWTYIM